MEVSMKVVLLSACLSLLAAQAQAISRYETEGLPCAEVQALVSGEGAAILRFRSTRDPSIQRYGRYVADRRYCHNDEQAQTAYVPAADTDSCPVRECIQVDPEDNMRLFRLH
jgi:hypothetical protein